MTAPELWLHCSECDEPALLFTGERRPRTGDAVNAADWGVSPLSAVPKCRKCGAELLFRDRALKEKETAYV